MPPASHLLQPREHEQVSTGRPQPSRWQTSSQESSKFSPQSRFYFDIFIYPFSREGVFSVLFLKFPEFKMSTFD